MQVQAVTPRGYCKGVIRAIQIAKKSVNQEKPIYILGMIVHNHYIVSALEDLGIITIDHPGKTRMELLDEIDSGTVIISAHGAGDEVFDKAKAKGLNIIDASCLDVIKSHDLIKQRLDEHLDVLYIGKQGHPESEGVLSLSSEHIHLIEKKEDIDLLDKNLHYMMTNQTTMSLYDVFELCEYAKKVLPFIMIEKETCSATKVRQEAIASLDEDVDIVFIVGDSHSNNTRKLAMIAREHSNKEVYMIDSVDELDIEVLKDKMKAAVSSGASTPTYLTNQVISYLRQFDYNNKDTYKKPIFESSHILD